MLAGNVEIDVMRVGDSGDIRIVMRGDAEDNRVDVSAVSTGQTTTFTFRGHDGTTISLSDSSNSVSSDGSSNTVQQVTFTGLSRMSALLGAGNDRVRFFGTQVGDRFDAKMGHGNDSIALHGISGGDISISTGSGNDSILLEGFGADGRVKLMTASGQDNVEIGDGYITEELS